MEKRLSHITSLVAELKEVLEKEESFWKAHLSEESRILESLLIEFEVRRLLGEIGEEEWTQKSNIIHLGLNSLKCEEASTSKIEPEPAPPIETVLEKHTGKKVRIQKEIRIKDRLLNEPLRRSKDSGEDCNVRDKGKGRLTKEPPELEIYPAYKVHCMNPWNLECRETDIGLSIYYKGRMVPICRRCWEEISKKNIEWTSL